MLSNAEIQRQLVTNECFMKDSNVSNYARAYFVHPHIMSKCIVCKKAQAWSYHYYVFGPACNPFTKLVMTNRYCTAIYRCLDDIGRKATMKS